MRSASTVEEQIEAIPAQGIVALGVMARLLEHPEVPRPLVVVEDDLLIQVARDPTLPEYLPDAVQRAPERVDVLAGVVHRQRGTRGGGHAKAIHDRLRAMMAGTDGNAFAIDDGADVVRVYAVEHERHDARLAARRADQRTPGITAHDVGGVGQQLLLVLVDLARDQST